MDEQTPLVSTEPRSSLSAVRPVIERAQASADDKILTVNCQVCEHIISFSSGEKKSVVRCSNCNEATPIRGPPNDKQYVRCPCNCLLICNAAAPRVRCPRTNCQNVVLLREDDGNSNYRKNVSGVLGRGGQPTQGGTFGSQSLRLACGNCNSLFSVTAPDYLRQDRFHSLISTVCGRSSIGPYGLLAARCPHCRKVTSVGPSYARTRWIIYLALTVVVILIAIGVTAGTNAAAQHNKSLYFLWSIIYLVALVLGLRAVRFMLMPVSSVDVPTLQI